MHRVAVTTGTVVCCWKRWIQYRLWCGHTALDVLCFDKNLEIFQNLFHGSCFLLEYVVVAITRGPVRKRSGL